MRNVLSLAGALCVALGVGLSVAFPRGGVAVGAVALMAAGLALFVIAWWEPSTVALLRRLLRRAVA